MTAGEKVHPIWRRLELDGVCQALSHNQQEAVMTMLGLRRLWGIRPGELVRPATMLGRGRVMGEPKSGPRGRGRVRRLERLRRGRGAP